MLASSYGIKNLKRVMPEIMNWTYEPNEGYMKAVRLYQNVVGQFDLYMGHVATNVAGIYHNPISVEQTDMKAVEYVPKDIQKKAVDFLNQSVDKGFLRLTLLENDSDMDSIRSMDGYKKVVERLKSKQLKMEEENAEYTDQTVEVPMTKESGVFKVKCSINGLPLHFVFDTGAANVTISAVEAAFMYKNNYLSDKDFMGSSSFLTASGDIIEGSVVNLRNVNFGGLDMNNVKATVVKTQNAPILLGQSVLSRLGKVEIDYSSYTIRITRKVKTTR